MQAAPRAFIDESRRYLSHEYLPKIRRSLQGLTDEDIWWRPNQVSNSIGNLILHLAGNARQWIVAGVGGERDTRDRQAEFDCEGGIERDDLVRRLESALLEVDRVLADLSVERFDERLEIQGLPTTVLGAVYHVVEHFSMHTGQIIYMSKLRSGEDLGFYKVSDGRVKVMW